MTSTVAHHILIPMAYLSYRLAVSSVMAVADRLLVMPLAPKVIFDFLLLFVPHRITY